MKVADIPLSASLLRQLLCLPEGTEIIGCRDTGSFGGILLRVTHPDLQDVKDGHAVPKTVPVISTRATDLGYGEVWVPQFDNWGQ